MPIGAEAAGPHPFFLLLPHSRAWLAGLAGWLVYLGPTQAWAWCVGNKNAGLWSLETKMGGGWATGQLPQLQRSGTCASRVLGARLVALVVRQLFALPPSGQVKRLLPSHPESQEQQAGSHSRCWASCPG